MPTFRTVLSLLGGLMLACGSEPRTPKPPDLAAAFPNLPLPPKPELISQTGSADALQLTLHTPSDLDPIVEYYRNALSSGNWRLVSDIKNPDGSVALYAEQDGPPMWARIWKPKGQSGAMVQLTGAVVSKDSTRRNK
ncbi:MAG TPA: hypothetical protein VGC48_01820 [Gemmatimonadales bacterium]